MSRHNLIDSVDEYEADVMDKYYEKQFTKKDKSLMIPEKAKMQEYTERLETMVKRWGVKKAFFKYHQCPLIVAGSWKSFEAPFVILKRK